MSYFPPNPNGQVTGANSAPVVLASDEVVPIGGLDFANNPTSIRTDTNGRLKISHGQPTAVTGSLAAINDQVAVPSDGFSDAVFYFSGTTVQTVNFEQSPDSTNGINGTWWPALGVNQTSSVAASTFSAITATHVFRVSAPAASYIRVKTTVYTSGTSAVQAVTTTAMAQPQITTTPSGTQATTVTSTTIAAPAATIAGLTVAKINSAATTNATSTKTSQARLLGWSLTNTSAATKYVRFYNKASAPTVGTDSPLFIVALPPTENVSHSNTQPITFAAGLAYAVTGAGTDLDATAVAVGDVIGSFYYV